MPSDTNADLAKRISELGDALFALHERLPAAPAPAASPAEVTVEAVASCGYCDGCGWVEGGAAIKTECAHCKGTGVALPKPFALREECGRLKDRVKEVEAEWAQCSRTIGEYDQEFESIEAKLAASERRCGELERENVRLENKRLENFLRYREAEKRLAASQAEVERLREAWAKLRAEITKRSETHPQGAWSFRFMLSVIDEFSAPPAAAQPADAQEAGE